MKITIVSSVYPPEPIVSAYTSEMIVQALVEKGYQVHVITGYPNRPKGRIFDGYKRKFFETKKASESLKMTRCFSFFSRNSTIISRSLENISFGVVSSLVLLFNKKPGVVYANTWPLFAQGFVALVCKLKNVPLVFSIQDIYPESLLSQNRINQDSQIITILRFFDRLITKSADALVVLSDGFAIIYRKTRKIPEHKIHVIPNFLKDNYQNAQITDSYRESLNISKTAFVFIYGGNIGAAAGLEKVVDVFTTIDNHCHLLIAGSGSQLEKCKESALGSSNIHFISPWPESETQKLLKTGDVALLPTIGEQSLASVPSKLINYMLAAKPILAIALHDSDIAKIIEETGCGWVISPGNYSLLVKTIGKIVETPKDVLVKMGQKGRSYALNHFTDIVCLPKIVGIIENVWRE